MRRSLSRRSALVQGGLLSLGGLAAAGSGGTLLSLLSAGPARAAAGLVGQPAPAFTGTDTEGRSVSLADLRGKVVVLEWTNHGCPFVRKHYDSGNMQALQAEMTGKGVVWLTIASSAEGEQGHVTAAEAKARMTAEKWANSHTLLDAKGSIGRAYDAKVTPHMYVIGKDGTLLYNGAIDDRPTAKIEDIAVAQNYLRPAVEAALAGTPVAVGTTKPYGCTVKYSKTSA
ncbi:thioredoxin family protein [Oleisolibacter albus]|uniref:thioredoxin family protein n=1 Tax=Oleisolibacter albus TaxID=2171757 RepID=UPI000DF3422C|nr:thioredoxin family protein [Oleisolibacter albus]